MTSLKLEVRLEEEDGHQCEPDQTRHGAAAAVSQLWAGGPFGKGLPGRVVQGQGQGPRCRQGSGRH